MQASKDPLPLYSEDRTRIQMSKAQDMVVRGLFVDYYKANLEELDPTGGNPYLQKVIAFANSTEDASNSEWIWVTVNPDNTKVSLIDFVKKCKKAFQKKWMLSSLYSFENHTKSGERFHCHCLIRKMIDKRPSEVKRELWNTFKTVCGNQKHVHIKFIKTEFHEQKEQYVYGNKDETKMDDVMKDAAWRKIYDLEPYYRYPLECDNTKDSD